MNRCVFCEIVGGRSPSSVVFQDERCIAFMDIQPVNPGHLLVVPIEHAATLSDLDEDVGAHVFRVAQRLAGALRASGIRCEGINPFLADGESAGQEVSHVHLHVLPRFYGDGFGLRFGPNYANKPDRQELEAAAQRVCDAL
jgi:histidine triad (HIT) family protein